MTEARRLLERAEDLLGMNVADSVEEIEHLKADIGAYLAQPMMTCEDVAAAVCFLEHSKRTHEAWAGWLAEGHEESPDAGDLEHHERCVLEYEHVLDVFRDAVAREGELVAALERRVKPFLKRVIEATKPYHENRDEPDAAETLFNIYEDAVMLRAALQGEKK